LGIEAQVDFLGERKDVSKLLKSAQVFAFASLSEGFPNALAEGLANGCACISFDCPTGPAELIRHDINGLLVALGDEQGYEREFSRLLGDAALRSRLSEQARLDMRRFSPNEVIEQFEQLIEA
jgi:GalNAc-alpha-(1->4)-GalNAc-alpha-(1->3)-diNAcBac-PP-undecaprenol alpha-1,4-N-acetyl-D-galactosaminyltransferase